MLENITLIILLTIYYIYYGNVIMDLKINLNSVK